MYAHPPIIPPGHNQACYGTDPPKPKKCALLHGAAENPSERWCSPNLLRGET